MHEVPTEPGPAARTGWAIDYVHHAAAQAAGVANGDLPDNVDLLERGLNSLRLMRFVGALRLAGVRHAIAGSGGDTDDHGLVQDHRDTVGGNQR